jgi:toxin ParE2
MASYRLLSEAKAELEVGVSFYDTESPGLDLDFALELRPLCRQILESPSAGFEVRPDVRCRMLRRFPYSILYAIEEGDVSVIAVAHQSRRPGYWHQRA